MVIPPVWHIGSSRRRARRANLETTLTDEERETVEAASFATKLVGYLVIGSVLAGAAYCLLRSPQKGDSSYESVPYVNH